MTSILFLHSNAEDYLADSLLHGLRNVLGADVVDVPRRDSLYAVEDQSRVYGRGFTLYGTLPDLEVWRGRPIDRARLGEFDVIVFGDIWAYWGPWVQLRSRLFELNGTTSRSWHSTGRQRPCTRTARPTGSEPGPGRCPARTAASHSSSAS